MNKEKEYYYEIKLTINGVLSADTKNEAMLYIKETFNDEHNIKLLDDEISIK